MLFEVSLFAGRYNYPTVRKWHRLPSPGKNSLKVVQLVSLLLEGRKQQHQCLAQAFLCQSRQSIIRMS
jgi:hypothetical protein